MKGEKGVRERQKIRNNATMQAGEEGRHEDNMKHKKGEKDGSAWIGTRL